jgi:hypothetical protein
MNTTNARSLMIFHPILIIITIYNLTLMHLDIVKYTLLLTCTIGCANIVVLFSFPSSDAIILIKFSAVFFPTYSAITSKLILLSLLFFLSSFNSLLYNYYFSCQSSDMFKHLINALFINFSSLYSNPFNDVL